MEGLVILGFVMDGFVMLGLVMDGLVIEGLYTSALVIEGLVMDGFVMLGLVIEGLVMLGLSSIVPRSGLRRVCDVHCNCEIGIGRSDEHGARCPGPCGYGHRNRGNRGRRELVERGFSAGRLWAGDGELEYPVLARGVDGEHRKRALQEQRGAVDHRIAQRLLIRR